MKLLFVDDESYNLTLYQDMFKESGHEMISTNNLEEARRLTEITSPDVMLLDLKFGRKTSDAGLVFLKWVRESHPMIEVIVISGSSRNLTKSAALIEYGAFDYLEKPVRAPHLQVIVERAMEKVRLVQENLHLRNVGPEPTLGIVGRSAAMKRLREDVQKIARVRSNVLIEGETGTGKEVVAKAIHLASASTRFLAVDCGSIPAELFASRLFGHRKGAFTSADTDQKGLFELIGNGTLFLDEVENLSIENQQVLLRCLEERKFLTVGGSAYQELRARLIFGTNVPLEELVAVGKFRADLMHRLNVITLKLPVLNERREDIPELAEHLNQYVGEQLGIRKLLHQETINLLKQRHWTGNVRELRNVLERALILGSHADFILPEDISDIPVSPSSGPIQSLKATEQAARKEAVERALKETGNPLEAALALRISPRHLSRLMTEYGIKR